MKYRPKCSLPYCDETMEFCLADGTRFTPANRFEAEIPRVILSDKSNYQTEKY